MKPPPIPEDEAERLAALRRFAVLDTDPEAGFDDLARLASFICATPIALVSLVDADRQWFKASVGLDGVAETPRAVSFCGHAVAGGGPLVVPDASLDDRFADNPLVTGAPDIRFYAGEPLTTGEGHVMGTLCVIDREPRQLSVAQRDALARLARQAVAQLELRERNEQLVQSERRFRGLVERAPFPVVCVDDERGCEYVNRAWTELTGLDGRASDADGWLEAVHAEHRERIASGRRGVSEPLVFDAAVYGVRGERRDVHAVVTRLEGGVIAALMDVTERRAAELAKEEIVAVASHELRTPLASIRGALGLAVAGSLGEVPDAMRPLLEAANDSSRHLARLVDDLLDVDRIGSGRLELTLAPVRVDELLRDLGRHVEGLVESSGVRLEVAAAEPVELQADRLRLLQALLNLVGNAIKFSPPGATVRVRALRLEGALRIEVCDEGPGVPESERERIFDRFERLEGSSGTGAEGAGLGLAIARGLVGLHGGNVGVEPRSPRGSVFFVVLPVLT